MAKQGEKTLILARTGELLDRSHAYHHGLEVYCHMAGLPSLSEDIVRLVIAHSQDFKPDSDKPPLSDGVIKNLRKNYYLEPENYIHAPELSRQLTDRALIAVNMINADADESNMEYELIEPFKNIEVLSKFYTEFQRFFLRPDSF